MGEMTIERVFPMAGNEVSAADGALAKGASVVGEAKSALTSELNSLEGKLSGLGAQWQGQGAVAFTRLMQQWQADSKKIINALDTFQENLTASQTTYSSTDESQSSQMNSLASRLS